MRILDDLTLVMSTSSPTTTDSSNTSESSSLPKVSLVTGGAGFIGYHTCHALLDRGDNVVIIDEMNDYYDPRRKQANVNDLLETFGKDRVSFYKGDVGNMQWTNDVFSATRPDIIVHLAARAGVRPSISDPLLYVESNIRATTVILEMARQYNCAKLVYASSSSVYGGSMKKSFSESDSVDCPVSPYAATKKSCELLAHTYHHLYKFDCIGLRFFTVYGPRGRPDMAPYMFIDRIAQGQEILRFGDGTSSRDYTYIQDIVDGLLRSIDRGTGCEIFNLGNGKPTRLSTFIECIEDLLQKKATIRVLPDQPGDVPRTCADITKAQRLLGYCPKVSLVEGLERTIEWYSTQMT